MERRHGGVMKGKSKESERDREREKLPKLKRERVGREELNRGRRS